MPLKFYEQEHISNKQKKSGLNEQSSKKFKESLSKTF